MKQIIGMLKSRSNWVNIIGGALQIVNLAQGQVIPAEYAVLIQMGLNIVLRFITKKPVSEK